MTEKQFKFDRDTVAPNIKTPIVFKEGERLSIGEVLDKLNELHDENYELKLDSKFKNGAYHKLLDSFTRLKRQNKELKEENNRLIKSTADVVAEHQRKVFDLIDKKIAEYEEKNHDANCGDCICVKYYDQIDALKELKKELSE